MTAFEGASLAQAVDLDEEMVLTLAVSLEGAATVMDSGGRGMDHEPPTPSMLIHWSEPGPGELAGTSGQPFAGGGQAAALRVASAAYWLLLGETHAARRCYAEAANSSSLTMDDRAVLSICAGQGRLGGDAPVSAFVATMEQLSSILSPNELQLSHEASLPIFRSPVLGIEQEDLAGLLSLVRRHASRAVEHGQRQEAEAIDAGFRSLIERGARPIDRARNDWRWSLQLGPLLPVEPELLVLSLLYVRWLRRAQIDEPPLLEGIASISVRVAELLLAAPGPG